MSLKNATARATIAVADIERAAEFYEGKLGLTPLEGGPDEVRIYELAGGSQLQVYVSSYAKASGATVASFGVDDLEQTVEELTAAGVQFERYDEPPTDERGIMDAGYVKSAWCKDPEGNVLAIDQGA